MNKKDAVNNIRETLKKLVKLSKEITKFGSLELTDGTKVTIKSEDLEVGGEIYQLDDQGNQTPLDDGEYTLTDGRTFVVKSNLIDSISGDDGNDDEDSSETPEDIENKKMDSNLPEGHDSAVADEKNEKSPDKVMSRLDDLEKAIEDIKEVLDKMSSIQNDVNEQMMSSIKKFSSEPGDKSIKFKKKESYNYDKSKIKKEEASELFEFFKTKSKEPVSLNLSQVEFKSLNK